MTSIIRYVHRCKRPPKKRAAVAITIVALLVTSAGQVGAQPLGHATFLSGEQLLNYCGSDNPATRDGCVGFAMGVADAAAEASAVESNRSLSCLPARGSHWLGGAQRNHTISPSTPDGSAIQRC
jgi:hypothetical protein